MANPPSPFDHPDPCSPDAPQANSILTYEPPAEVSQQIAIDFGQHNTHPVNMMHADEHHITLVMPNESVHQSTIRAALDAVAFPPVFPIRLGHPVGVPFNAQTNHAALQVVYGLPQMKQLYATMRDAFTAANIVVEVSDPYWPHLSIGYRPHHADWETPNWEHVANLEAHYVTPELPVGQIHLHHSVHIPGGGWDYQLMHTYELPAPEEPPQ